MGRRHFILIHVGLLVKVHCPCSVYENAKILLSMTLQGTVTRYVK